MIEQLLVKLAPRGQVVIPKLFRDMLHMKIGTHLLVTKEGDRLIVEKHSLHEGALYDEMKQKRLDKRLRAEGEIFV